MWQGRCEVALWLAIGAVGCSSPAVIEGAGAGGTFGPDISSVACSGGSTGSQFTSRFVFQAKFPATTVVQPVAPPAISGGTLRVLADGKTAVAADPDRDRIFIADLGSRTLRATVALDPGDEPGRVAEDASGRVHVALRRGGAIVTVDPVTANVLARRPVCAAPRGLAYDATSDLVHVACADGELVSLPAAGGAPVRELRLDRDLRDVVVDGTRLYVSRFRTAELLTLQDEGMIPARSTPYGFRTADVRGGQLFTSSLAERTIAAPGGGVLMLHERGVVDEISRSVSAYSGGNPCDAVVHPAISRLRRDGSLQSGPALAGLVLAVDLALSPDASKLAVVSAGSADERLPRVFVTGLDAAIDNTVGCRMDGLSAPCIPASQGSSSPSTCTPDPTVPEVAGQAIAVAYAGDGTLVVQSREPAVLSLTGGTIPLSDESRADTGHLLFHANPGGFVACASCHAEGDDDGRTWRFTCVGTRRTQSLQVGLRGSEPFNWSGNEPDFHTLASDVFVSFMGGPSLPPDQEDALLGWLDAQPRPRRAPPRSPAAVERGRALFADTQGTGCVTCHAGPRFSNNETHDVGTGAAFQVPSLLGIGTRGPFLHDGSAKTLKERFLTQGGGDKHGMTSALSDGQIDDLVAYLDSL